MKKAILYTRIQTRHTDDKDATLIGQELRLREYCGKNQIEVIRVYQDADIDLGDEPTGMLRLIKDLESKTITADLLLFTSIYKLSNSLEDIYRIHHSFKEYGITPKAIDPVKAYFIIVIKKEI